MISSKPTSEALKEIGRLILVAILPVLLTSINVQNGDISFNFKIIAAVALLTVIKALDKYVHTYGKEIESESLTRGITRF